MPEKRMQTHTFSTFSTKHTHSFKKTHTVVPACSFGSCLSYRNDGHGLRVEELSSDPLGVTQLYLQKPTSHKFQITQN